MDLLLPVAEIRFNGTAQLQESIKALHQGSSKAAVETNEDLPAIMREQIADAMMLRGRKAQVPPPMASRLVYKDR